jgi:uncharacterized Rmd1/YagE family protein
MGTEHTFYGAAFAENFTLKDLAPRLPEAKATSQDLRLALPGGGTAFYYAFGAVVFWNVPAERRDAEIERLGRLRPGLAAEVVHEEFQVYEDPAGGIAVTAGKLVVDRLDLERAAVVALTVGQSAAMEYYERIVTQLFERTGSLVSSMERTGTVPLRTRRMHRFIAEAIGTRSEVLSVLHLLDKPDAVWEDAAMDRIYADLRGEFDLGDRYRSLEVKLRSVQESLELVLDVARDRRLVLLELAVILLILFELAATVFRR